MAPFNQLPIKEAVRMLFSRDKFSDYTLISKFETYKTIPEGFVFGTISRTKTNGQAFVNMMNIKLTKPVDFELAGIKKDKTTVDYDSRYYKDTHPLTKNPMQESGQDEEGLRSIFFGYVKGCNYSALPTFDGAKRIMNIDPASGVTADDPYTVYLAEKQYNWTYDADRNEELLYSASSGNPAHFVYFPWKSDTKIAQLYDADVLVQIISERVFCVLNDSQELPYLRPSLYGNLLAIGMGCPPIAWASTTKHTVIPEMDNANYSMEVGCANTSTALAFSRRQPGNKEKFDKNRSGKGALNLTYQVGYEPRDLVPGYPSSSQLWIDMSTDPPIARIPDAMPERSEVSAYPIGSDIASIVLEEGKFLRFGDVRMPLCVEAISVKERPDLDVVGLLRNKGNMKRTSGHTNTQVDISVLFRGVDEINGFTIDANGVILEDPVTKERPILSGLLLEHFGLRPLIATFRRAPFIPVVNSTLNTKFDIDALAFVSMQLLTEDGAPGIIRANLSFVKFDYSVYLSGIQNFSDAFNWPLYQKYVYNGLCVPKDQGLITRSENGKFNITSLGTKKMYNVTPGDTNKLPVLTEEDYASSKQSGYYSSELIDAIHGIKELTPASYTLKVDNKQARAKLKPIPSLKFNYDTGAFSRNSSLAGGVVFHIADEEQLKSIRNNGIQAKQDLQKNATLLKALNKEKAENAKRIPDINKEIKELEAEIEQIKRNPGELWNTGPISDPRDIWKDSPITKFGTVLNSPNGIRERQVWEPKKTPWEIHQDEEKKKAVAWRLSKAELELISKKQKRIDELKGRISNIEGEIKSGNSEQQEIQDRIDAVKRKMETYSEEELTFKPINLPKDAVLEGVEILMVNNFAQQPVESRDNPVLQYLGASDTVIRLGFQCNHETVSALHDLRQHLQYLSREYRWIAAKKDDISVSYLEEEDAFIKNINDKYAGQQLETAFLLLDQEIANLCGIESVMITDIDYEKIPEAPDWYNVTLNLIDFDRTQKKHEKLNKITNSGSFNATGFNLAYTDLYGHKDPEFDVKNLNSMATTDQMQKMLYEIETYPDLELPTLATVNAWIHDLNIQAIEEGLTDRHIAEPLSAPEDDPRLLEYCHADPDFYISTDIETPANMLLTTLYQHNQQKVNMSDTHGSGTMSHIVGKHNNNDVNNGDDEAKRSGSMSQAVLHIQKNKTLHTNLQSSQNESDNNGKAKSGGYDTVINKRGGNSVTVKTSTGVVRAMSVEKDRIKIKLPDNKEQEIPDTRYRISGTNTYAETEAARGKALCRPAGIYGGIEFKEASLFSNFSDWYQHGKSGRLIKAFPAYWVTLIDSGRLMGQLVLNDYFYGLNGLSSLTIVKNREHPADLCMLTMSNVYGNFTNITAQRALDEGIRRKGVGELNYYIRNAFVKFPSSADLDRRDQDVAGLSLQPGGRLHVRMGYGSCPVALPVIFNGTITEVPGGEGQIEIIAMGDGLELLNDCQGEPNQTLGSFVHGSEPQDILAPILGARGGLPAPLGGNLVKRFGNWFQRMIYNTFPGFESDNPLGVVHFGNPFYKVCDEVYGECMQNIYRSNDRGARPGHCFDDSTELLTENGWLSHDKLVDGLKVMTLNRETDQLEWNNIEKIFRYDNFDEMIHVKAKFGLDLAITAKHGLWVGSYVPNKKGNRKWKELDAEVAFGKKLAFRLAGNYECADIPLSDSQIRVLAWIISEGNVSLNPNRTHVEGIRISQSAGRNGTIDQLEQDLSDAELKYSKNLRYKEGTTEHGTYRNYDAYRLGILDSHKQWKSWIGQYITTDKIPTDLLRHMSLRQRRIFLKTYISADGQALTNNASVVCTNNKEILDFLQMLAATSGNRTCTTKGKDGVYSLHLNSRQTVRVEGKHWSKEPYKGTAWCVSVPNHTLIVRRNGKTAITMNTYNYDRNDNEPFDTESGNANFKGGMTNYWPADFSQWLTFMETMSFGQKEFSTELYGKTLWDLAVMSTQVAPDYICSVVPFQFRSSLFYGKPYYPYCYDYKMSQMKVPEYEDKSKSEAKWVVYGTHPSHWRNKDGTEKVTDYAILNDTLAQEIYNPVVYCQPANDKSLHQRYVDMQLAGNMEQAQRRISKKFVNAQLRKPFQQVYPINSSDDIIADSITASSEGVYTVVRGKYKCKHFKVTIPLIGDVGDPFAGPDDGSGRGVSADMTLPVYADYTMFPENKRAITVDTQIYVGRVDYFASLMTNRDPHGNLANNVATTILKNYMSYMYKGTISIMGIPSIKPYDCLVVDDSYNELHGPVGVREVVHQINSGSGMTSTIEPDALVSIADQRLLRNWSLFRNIGGMLAYQRLVLTTASETRGESAPSNIADKIKLMLALVDTYVAGNNSILIPGSLEMSAYNSVEKERKAYENLIDEIEAGYVLDPEYYEMELVDEKMLHPYPKDEKVNGEITTASMHKTSKYANDFNGGYYEYLEHFQFKRQVAELRRANRIIQHGKAPRLPMLSRDINDIQTVEWGTIQKIVKEAETPYYRIPHDIGGPSSRDIMLIGKSLTGNLEEIDAPNLLSALTNLFNVVNIDDVIIATALDKLALNQPTVSSWLLDKQTDYALLESTKSSASINQIRGWFYDKTYNAENNKIRQLIANHALYKRLKSNNKLYEKLVLLLTLSSLLLRYKMHNTEIALKTEISKDTLANAFSELSRAYSLVLYTCAHEYGDTSNESKYTKFLTNYLYENQLHLFDNAAVRLKESTFKGDIFSPVALIGRHYFAKMLLSGVLRSGGLYKILFNTAHFSSWLDGQIDGAGKLFGNGAVSVKNGAMWPERPSLTTRIKSRVSIFRSSTIGSPVQLGPQLPGQKPASIGVKNKTYNMVRGFISQKLRKWMGIEKSGKTIITVLREAAKDSKNIIGFLANIKAAGTAAASGAATGAKVSKAALAAKQAAAMATMGELSNPVGWIMLAAQVAATIITGTLINKLNCFMANLHACEMVLLHKHGVEFSAGINGHQGLVYGDNINFVARIFNQLSGKGEENDNIMSEFNSTSLQVITGLIGVRFPYTPEMSFSEQEQHKVVDELFNSRSFVDQSAEIIKARERLGDLGVLLGALQRGDTDEYTELNRIVTEGEIRPTKNAVTTITTPKSIVGGIEKVSIPPINPVVSVITAPTIQPVVPGALKVDNGVQQKPEKIISGTIRNEWNIFNLTTIVTKGSLSNDGTMFVPNETGQSTQISLAGVDAFEMYTNNNYEADVMRIMKKWLKDNPKVNCIKKDDDMDYIVQSTEGDKETLNAYMVSQGLLKAKRMQGNKEMTAILLSKQTAAIKSKQGVWGPLSGEKIDKLTEDTY